MDQQLSMEQDIDTIIGMMDSIITDLTLMAIQSPTILGVVGASVLIWIMDHHITGFIVIFGGRITIDHHFITTIIVLVVGGIIMARVVGAIIQEIIMAREVGGIILATIVAQVVQVITQGTIIAQEVQAIILVIITVQVVLATTQDTTRTHCIIKDLELDHLRNQI